MMMIILHDVAGHAEEYNYVFNLYDIYIYIHVVYTHQLFRGVGLVVSWMIPTLTLLLLSVGL